MPRSKRARVSLPGQPKASSGIATIVDSEPLSQQACTEQDIKNKWFVLSHIYATAFQTRAPLNLEAYEGIVGKAWNDPIDNVFNAIVKRRDKPDPLSPEDETILEELRLRNLERVISQFSLFQAGYRWGLKRGMIEVEKLGGLPLLSNDFSVQSLLEHMPEATSNRGPHSRKAHYLTTNFTDFDIHQIIGHIEQQPGSRSYLAYHSKLGDSTGTHQPTAEAKSKALNDAKLDPRDFLPSKFTGTEVGKWIQGP